MYESSGRGAVCDGADLAVSSDATDAATVTETNVMRMQAYPWEKGPSCAKSYCHRMTFGKAGTPTSLPDVSHCSDMA